MRLLHRISSTISARVDQAITRVENHDAIIQAAIKRTQSNAATARVRLARVKKDGDALRNKRDSLRQAVEDWTRRAREVADDDKGTALECVRRLRLIKGQLSQVTQSLKQHSELEKQVERTLHDLHDRLAEMNQQRNMLRSRESVADAMRVINELDGVGNHDIEDTFERWEVMITEVEFDGSLPTQVDDLEARFIHEEDRAELEADLQLLLSEKGDDHEPV
ncbi:MAG: PspA/IM30 family protein [Gammaproteobacteria bacterium]